MKRINLKDRAEAVKRTHRRIGKQLSQTRDKFSEEALSRKIEDKIKKTHKLSEDFGVVIFSEKSLANISHFSSYGWALASMLLAALVLVFPTTAAELDVFSIFMNWGIVFVLLVFANALVFGIMKAAGSKARFKVFISVVNISLALSLLIVSIPIALVAFAIFFTTEASDSAISMFFSFIPFYNYLIWGWSCETIAQFKGKKSIFFALLCLLIILFLHLALPYILI